MGCIELSYEVACVHSPHPCLDSTAQACLALKLALMKSTLMLPPSQRVVSEFRVGYLLC